MLTVIGRRSPTRRRKDLVLRVHSLFSLRFCLLFVRQPIVKSRPETRQKCHFNCIAAAVFLSLYKGNKRAYITWYLTCRLISRIASPFPPHITGVGICAKVDWGWLYSDYFLAIPTCYMETSPRIVRIAPFADLCSQFYVSPFIESPG